MAIGKNVHNTCSLVAMAQEHKVTTITCYC